MVFDPPIRMKINHGDRADHGEDSIENENSVLSVFSVVKDFRHYPLTITRPQTVVSYRRFRRLGCVMVLNQIHTRSQLEGGASQALRCCCCL